MTTLFHMYEPFRQHIIDGHNFYIDQARKRLLSQFSDMETEADKHGEEWLEKCSESFDPENHDPYEFYDQAREESYYFYSMLDDMRRTTYLSVAAGMFHQWEKQLKDWTLKEIKHWHRGKEVAAKICKANFDMIIELFEDLGWEIKSKDYYNSLNRCRLVTNAYKHGNGDALEEIQKSFPEFLQGGELGLDVIWPKYTDHTDLYIEDKHINEFSGAIVAFWEGVPEYITNKGTYDNIPKWFENAYNKDVAPRKQSDVERKVVS